MHLFVRTYEEPTLRKSLGAQYQTFALMFPGGYPVSLHGMRTQKKVSDAPGSATVRLSGHENTRQGLVDNAVAREVRPSIRTVLLRAHLWSSRGFCRNFGLVGGDSNRLDFQSLVHIEALLAIQTLHEFPSGLSNRTTNTGRINLDRAAIRTRFAVFIFQSDIVSIQNNLQTVS